MRGRDVIVIASMTRLWVRLALVFAGIAAIAAAGFAVWSSESRTRASDASLRLATDAGRRALVATADLRAAQQAYVAVGQGEDFWFARAASLSNDLDDVLTLFRKHLASDEALAAARDAAAALQDLQQVDKRAREYTRARQLTQASDIIFGDGFELTQKLTASVTRALAAEAVAHDAATAEIQRRQRIALAAGAGIGSLALLLLIPAGSTKTPEPTILLSPAASVIATLDESTDGVVSMAVQAPVPAPAPPAPAPEASPVDLAGVASLCSDLASVSDTRAIPALLERAAGVLNAAGAVLWIADPDGRELAPVVVHGYPPRLANRLGTIARDAANLTASAYRTGLLQTVKGDTVSNGAVAAPLVTSSGCLGVMALEMNNGGEQREPLLAAATIIASQLSTLVGPPSARARTEAAS
jgi:hypothetical protein